MARKGRKKRGTVTKSVRIKKEHSEWLRDSHISLSGVVQAHLDELIERLRLGGRRQARTWRDISDRIKEDGI